MHLFYYIIVSNNNLHGICMINAPPKQMIKINIYNFLYCMLKIDESYGRSLQCHRTVTVREGFVVSV